MNTNMTGIYESIGNLTHAKSGEIQEYTAEITLNKKFHNDFKENQDNFGGRGFSGWSIGTTLGTALYTLCRKVRPDIVIETGVASGVSSSYILCGLEENQRGALYSIDLAWREGHSGWIIPDYLRHRWQLVMGRSYDKLPPLLEKLGTIDIFLHDSEHSYRNMLFEYQTAWAHLKPGGLLLSHNIYSNNAFSGFCESVNHTGYEFGDFGAIAKT